MGGAPPSFFLACVQHAVRPLVWLAPAGVRLAWWPVAQEGRVLLPEDCEDREELCEEWAANGAS